MDDETEGGSASSRTDPRRPGAPAGSTPGVAGWYPDPFSNKLQRWWTGQSWTFSTTDPTSPGAPPPPPPPAVTPLPASAAPPPVVPPKEPRTARLGPMIKRNRVAVAVVLGLIVGLLGAKALHRPARPTTSAIGPTTSQGRTPTSAPPTTAAPQTNNDPSASALSSLIVKPADVTAPSTVALLPGGAGLGVATLDLCNGNFPSDDLRTARLQDGVFDAQENATLSTEAVLYGDSAATTQAFSELKSVAAACPSTPVPSESGPVTTKFNPAPDANWPQTPTVNRLAYDFTSTDGSGQANHTIAVYLQRGRVLMGVYFFQPDGDQAPVAGQTTVAGIVGVFAGRMAALPTSVVGS
jgi:hypothetical protein